jgi:hypothetical protein
MKRERRTPPCKLNRYLLSFKTISLFSLSFFSAVGNGKDEGPEKATRGGEWEPIKIPRGKLGLYSEINPTLLSSNSAKTANL